MTDNQQFIRIVQDTDASALLTIYEYYVQHTAITFEYIAPNPSEFAERINITLQKFPWLVYIADNQILGYAYANVFRYREAYEWSVESSVYVHHETQSKGIGKILYQTLFEILELQGFVNVIGGITLPNEKSENLHSSFGFRKVGIFENVGYKFEQWHSIVFYEKAINPHAKTLEKPFLFTQIRHTEEFSSILKNVNLKLIHNLMLIDLSHTIEAGMITYKGLPAPIICDYLSREDSKNIYEGGAEFQIGKIEMITNTGTYLDCPFHRYTDGKDLSEIELSQFTDLEAIVIRADWRKQLSVDVSFFENRDLKDKAVLIDTNWSEHWRTDQYFENHPFVSTEAAEYLKNAGVKLVGIDSHNIDDTRTKARPVHSILLKHEILIVEHLCNLSALPESGFTFSAVPPKFKGVGTFPVRAFARI